jgi:16S rRNA (guanine527-N7)-methyltransferase
MMLTLAQKEKLEHYASLITRWQKAINLVAPSTLSALWERHILDSVQLAPHIADGSRLLDIGSGGGLPGVVLAMLLPDAHVTLVESDRKKCEFLLAVSRETATPFHVENTRIESLPPHHADIITSRACAALPQLLAWAPPHLNEGGKMLFLKGKNHPEEILDAQKKWSFSVDVFPSQVSQDGVVLEISKVKYR